MHSTKWAKQNDWRVAFKLQCIRNCHAFYIVVYIFADVGCRSLALLVDPCVAAVAARLFVSKFSLTR